MSRRARRGAAIFAGIVAAAGVAVGSVVAGGIDVSNNAAGLDAALVDARAIKLVDIPAADGLQARGVFAQITSTGHFCLSDAPLDSPEAGGGGCNLADDPLGGSPISASLAYDGGPSIATVTDARVIGLTSADVATVRVEMIDGTSRAIKLKKANVGSEEFQAFGYRFKKADLKKGIGPVAVVAYDASGAELGRQPTGIG